MSSCIHQRKVFISIAITLVFCLPSARLFSQPVSIVSPVGNHAFTLPDPAVAQTAVELQNAVTAAEITAKALSADAVSEKATAVSQENELAKTAAAKNDYIAALNSFNKADVTPYKQDLDKYTASGTSFNNLLAKYNKAVLANNALPAKNRKAATVAALNEQKVQIDAWGAQLSKWKARLDAAKAKLDVKNAALQKQQQKYESTEQTSTAKLRACRINLKSILDELQLCAGYADKCRALQLNRFKDRAAPDTGYFTTPAYKSTVADLNAYLEKTKNL